MLLHINALPQSAWKMLALRRVRHEGLAFNYRKNQIQEGGQVCDFSPVYQPVLDRLKASIACEVQPTSHQLQPDSSSVLYTVLVSALPMASPAVMKAAFGFLDLVIEQSQNLEKVPFTPDQLTINCYEPGSGIPPHVDSHSAFSNTIVALSLGSPVVMDFLCDPCLSNDFDSLLSRPGYSRSGADLCSKVKVALFTTSYYSHSIPSIINH